jgi:serine/threonine protein kinase
MSCSASLRVDDVCAAQVKVADFGLSVAYRPGSHSTSTAGSLPYLAPEVLSEKGGSGIASVTRVAAAAAAAGAAVGVVVVHACCWC